MANVVATVDKVKSFEIFRVKVWLTLWCSRRPLWIYFPLAKFFSCISANIFRYFLIWLFLERLGKIRIFMYKRLLRGPFHLVKTETTIWNSSNWLISVQIHLFIYGKTLKWYQLLPFTATIVFLVLYTL